MALKDKNEGRKEGGEDGVKGLDEATSAALGIDFPEPFGLFALEKRVSHNFTEGSGVNTIPSS